MEMMCFRSILNEELGFRRNENPSYSMRAFARDLGINPSQMSEVLGGKTGLSSKKAICVAENMGLNKKETVIFKALVESEHGRSTQIINNAKKILDENRHSGNFKNLSIEGFKFMSDWIFYAILCTMELDHYDGTIDFISRKLGASTSEIEKSLKLLLKLDIIDIKDCKFVVSGEMFTTTHDISSQAIRKFHKQQLRKSIEALDTVDVEDRDITAVTMAIDKAKIPEAKEKIKEFRRSLCKFLEGGEKNEVYSINIQLIPLSKLEQS